jgi:hypothetical protein
MKARENVGHICLSTPPRIQGVRRLSRQAHAATSLQANRVVDYAGHLLHKTAITGSEEDRP